MVADMDPISVGSFYAAFDRMIGGGVNTSRVEATFHPRLNAVALEFRYEFVTFRQFWDEAARRHFAWALEQYNADFEARTLVNQQRRTRSVYGRVVGRLEWQTTRFGVVHVAYPVIELGYRFRENAPFFATLMRSARPGGGVEAGSAQTESRQMFMYFTRAQAADLVRMFDQAFLLGLLEMHDVPEQIAPPTWDEFPLNGSDRSTDGDDADGYSEVANAQT